ncbi:hypothetical protein [Neotamlana laminarinivorans]|uniref:Uncharacterized protein n=1 Tax=Neotamlana laminarinivorans TaxID=2883124 RepID=A0A9X1I1X1_9FLAO|nr:hypothetical protein [Tamlana laminarinivorans]MCB4800284.1 hypothetical protein [Tamlana laminarinivorans]
MKKTTILISIILLIGIKINAQELTCKDFKIGQFYIPTTEELKDFTIIKNDSIQNFEIQLDSTITKTVIERKKDTQTEWINGIGNGQPAYEKIEWIDDCTYRLTYDESKMELDETEKWVNENDGIVVSKRKIEENCLFYTATMTSNNGEKFSQSGVICKK